jgi:hypothetical protein
MLFYDLQIYKDLVELSKTLNVRIKQMDSYYRRDSGDEMRKLLRDIRFSVYEANCHPDEEKEKYITELIRKFVKLKILIDDAIENGGFKISGKKNVVICIKQLRNVTSQATKWKNYIRNQKKNNKFDKNLAYDEG